MPTTLGVLVDGAIFGAATGGIASCANGGNAREIATQAALEGTVGAVAGPVLRFAGIGAKSFLA